MSKVSDMIKMYSQQNTAGPKPPSSATRKWPPVNTSVGGSPVHKPPPPSAPKPAMNGSRPGFGPKPSALHPGGHSTAPWKTPKTENNNSSWQRKQADQEEKIPAWKQRLHENKEEKPVPPWQAKQQDQNNVPSWRARQEPEKNNASSWMNRQRDNESKNIPSWKTPQPEQESKTNSPPWKPRQQVPGLRNSWGKPSQNESSPVSSNSVNDFPLPPSPWKNTPPPPVPKTAPEPEMQEDEDMYLESSPAHYPAPINLSPPKKPFSTGFPSMPKPSSGSFKPSSTMRNSNDSEEKAGRRNQSFLHAPAAPKFPGPKPSGPKPSSPNLSNEVSLPPPPPPSSKPTKVNGVPPRLQIPPEKYSESPPIKQSKPPNVVLPTKGKKKFGIPPLLKPKSPMRDLPPPPPQDDFPPLPARDPEPPPLPPMTRSLPIPQSMDTPPSLPTRRPLPSPTPDKKSMPLPAVPPTAGLPPPLPPAPSDDIYEDTAEAPALPPMRQQPVAPPMRQPVASPPEQSQGIELIPTYESDEEDQGAIYDETADDVSQSGSQFPQMSGYSPAGSFPPEPEEIEEDTYEDVDEYMRLKKLQQPPPQANQIVSEGSKKDKKKNASDKKEKDLRKKFKLPLEGDITPVGKGRVKENMKGGWGSSKGLSVTTDEWVDVIRMTDNPKGKWLARNNNGEYGYVDSDKVEINTSDLRSMMGGGHGFGGDSSFPQIIPTDEDDEVIYDQTADEDIYEEV